MGYMNFKSPTLEKVFKQYKYTRNSTILFFQKSISENILDSKSPVSNSFSFQPVLFQFQCIVTTTDRYFRKITGMKNLDYGILVRGDTILKKDQITADVIDKELKIQLKELEEVFKSISDTELEKLIDDITLISNHEYLHLGQLILMFREAGVDVPERFRKAWAL